MHLRKYLCNGDDRFDLFASGALARALFEFITCADGGDPMRTRQPFILAFDLGVLSECIDRVRSWCSAVIAAVGHPTSTPLAVCPYTGYPSSRFVMKQRYGSLPSHTAVVRRRQNLTLFCFLLVAFVMLPMPA